MKLNRARIVQIISLLVAHVITLIILANFLDGFSYTTLRSLVTMTILVAVAQSLFWWVFITLFSWLPFWLYPLMTFILNGAFIMVVGNLIPGITISNIATGIWISIWLTVINAILGGILSLDQDAQFDRNVTRRMVEKRGKPTTTDVPGFLFLEIDGLGEAILRRAIEEGHMPTLKRWLDTGSHKLIGWETDFTAQTGAMQTGILLGNNTDVPAYRWWDREVGKVVMSGIPKDAQAIEARLSSGKGLCSDGGASRGNMFSGDATESMFTFSTLLNKSRGRGPSFYFYLASPYVLARLITRFVIVVVKEWWEAAAQRRRKDKYTVSARNLAYAFLRAFMSATLQDLTTYTVISDVLRGVPAVYALFAGYDDLAHFAGMNSPEAIEELHETDRYFARIENAVKGAPRPYHMVILSDHGQTIGPTFKAAYGMTLEELVKKLVKADDKVFVSLETDNAWENINAVLNESVNSTARTAGVVRRMLKSKEKEGMVDVMPDQEAVEKIDAEAKDSNEVVMGSGCTGLIYFTQSKQRMTFEKIQDTYPELMIGLANHPGIGFIMVNSEEFGPMVMRMGGIHYLSDDRVDGIDPLAIYGPRAAEHLRRESSFTNCPDIVVNTLLDPETQEMPGFENQVSHHGGLGGPQNHAFVMYPSVLPYDGQPVIRAENVYKLLRGWRDHVQNPVAG